MFAGFKSQAVACEADHKRRQEEPVTSGYMMSSNWYRGIYLCLVMLQCNSKPNYKPLYKPVSCVCLVGQTCHNKPLMSANIQSEIFKRLIAANFSGFNQLIVRHCCFRKQHVFVWGLLIQMSENTKNTQNIVDDKLYCIQTALLGFFNTPSGCRHCLTSSWAGSEWCCHLCPLQSTYILWFPGWCRERWRCPSPDTGRKWSSGASASCSPGEEPAQEKCHQDDRLRQRKNRILTFFNTFLKCLLAFIFWLWQLDNIIKAKFALLSFSLRWWHWMCEGSVSASSSCC